MALFNMVITICSLTFKAVVLLLKVCVVLFEKGVLLPVVVTVMGCIVSSYILNYAYQQENPAARTGFTSLAVVVYIVFVIFLILWAVNVVRKNKKMIHETTQFNKQNSVPTGIVFGKRGANCYDPFYCLRTSANPAQDAMAIAQAIIPLPLNTREPFWIENAQNILTACILHFSKRGLSFLDTVRNIQSSPIKTLIEELRGDLETVYFVNSFSDMDDRVLSSIMAELSKNLVPFVTDKHLISALSRQKHITPADLECGCDVFVQIPEHLLRQWKTLLTLMVNQFLTHFEKRSETGSHPILFLLDEFPCLGKVSAMLDGLATLRSKKISICLIVQSLAQLDVIYGSNERKVIADTCSYKAVLGATDADTQDYFSRLVGTVDKWVKSQQRNSDFLGLPQGGSVGKSEQERRIIKPEEFGRLKGIVLLTPNEVLRVDKVPYYEKQH